MTLPRLRWIAAGLAAVVLAAAGIAFAQDRARGEGRRKGGGREERAARFLRERARDRRHGAMLRMKRLMDLPGEQVRAALEAAEAAGKVRDGAREKAAALLVEAFREAKDATPERKAEIRARTRERMKALRDEAKAGIAEAGAKAAAALTPEQRARIEERARAKGRTVDGKRLALGLGWRLSNPRVRAVLRARAGD